MGEFSLLRAVWRWWLLIVLSTAVGVGAAYLYVQRSKPIYTGTSRVLVEKPLSERSAVDILQPGATATNFLPQQASIMVSRQIVSRALNSPQVLGLSTLKDSRLQDVVRTLTARVGKDDIINVSASSDDPNQAAVVVNAVVQEYIAWQDLNRQASASDLLVALNRELEKTKTSLERKRQEVMAAAERIGIVEDAQGGIVSGTLDAAKQELVAARLCTAQRESYYNRLAKLEANPNKARQYVLSQGGVESADRTRLAEDLRRIQLQLEEASAGNVRAVTESQIALWKKQVSDLTQKIAEFDKECAREQIAAAWDALSEARKQEEKLKQLQDNELARLHMVRGQSSQYELRKAEYVMLESHHNTLLGKINSFDLNASLGGLGIHVLETAVPGVVPSPQMRKFLPLGLAFGLIVGTGLSLISEWIGRRGLKAKPTAA